MKKALKIGMILIVVGFLVFFAVLAFNGFNLTKIFKGDYQTNTYNINEDFNEISLIIDTADVMLVKSQDGKCKIECYEKADEKHIPTVENKSLTIKLEDNVKWYNSLFNFGNPKIKIYLPKLEYEALIVKADTSDIELNTPMNFKSVNMELSTGDISLDGVITNEIKLSVSTGDMELDNINCNGNISLNCSTGDIEINNVNCKNLTSTGSTGEISLDNLIATEKIYIERSTGDVEFDRMDAGEIFIETSTGDVEGSLLSEKIFIVETSTGKERVPETTSGGKCKITTSTGDVFINIK